MAEKFDYEKLTGKKEMEPEHSGTRERGKEESTTLFKRLASMVKRRFPI